jgi:hypothetical protein
MTRPSHQHDLRGPNRVVPPLVVFRRTRKCQSLREVEENPYISPFLGIYAVSQEKSPDHCIHRW